MIKRKLQRKAAPIRVVVLRRLRKIIAKVTSTSTQVAITCVSLVVHAAQPVVPVSNNQLPTGAAVASGQVSITSSSTANSANMQIIQTTPQAIINWNTFNVGANAKVNIQEPSAQSAILNRVGDANPTKIYGQITSNGQVFISNANGVYFSPTASVEVGGLVATTQAISDADFLSGKATFTRNDATGKVINKGTLKSSLGGYIALLAPEVINEGVVIAKMGSAVMASGDHITLNFNKAGSLLGVVTSESTIKTLIDNKNAVIAPGGLIILSAGAAQTLQSAVVKVSGSLIASSMKSEGGKIILQGSDIITTSTSRINANGATGGGSVSISGTQSVAIQPGTSINASSTSTGNGGAVSISAGSNLLVAGTITAQGGLVSGNGGHVQMTTNGSLALDSALVVNAGALSSSGLPGAWTVNAQALNINAAAAKAISTSLDTNHVNLNASQLYCDSSCSQSSVGQLKLAPDALIQKTTGVDTSLHLYSDSVVDILGSVSNLSNNNLSLSITTPGQVLVGSKASVSATQITATATGIDILGMLFGTNNGSTGNGGTGDSGSANIPLINLFGVRVSVAGSIRSKSQNGGLSTIDIEGKEYIEITNTAAIDASSSLNGGNIRVVSSSGAVDVQGLIQTNGGSGRGGTIAVSGVVSTTFEGASLNANGLQNGGKILIGNDSLNGSLPFSAFTALNSSTSLSTTALNSQNKSGGFIETSGHTLQMLATINVGRGGIWLLDPTDLIIDDNPLDTNASVKASDITTALISGNVVLSTSATPLCTGVNCVNQQTGTTGNITILSNISWNNTNSLTFNADGGVTGSGNISMTGAGALYINQAGTSTYSGLISGSGSVTKDGLGTLVFTGNNTYSGGTNISSGTLQIGNAGSTGKPGSSAVVVGADSTLSFNFSSAQSFTNGFTFTDNNATLANISSGTTAMVTLSGGVNGGNAGASVLNGGTAGITVSGAATPPAQGARLNLAGNIIFTGDSLNALVIRSISPNTTITFNTTVTPWWLGSTTAANAPNIIVSSGVSVTEGTGQTAGDLYYKNISGLGTLNLTSGWGSANVLGLSTISTLAMSGTPLYIGNGGSGAQINSGNVSSTSGLYLNSTDSYTYAGIYSGAGGLVQQGSASVVTLSGTNTYLGGTSVTAGSLKLANTAALGNSSGAVVVSGGATLDLNGIAVANTNPLTLNGLGLNSAGALTNSSATNASYAGSISLATDSSVGGSSGNIALSGVLTSANSLKKIGSNTLTLSNTNSVSGNLSISAGTLQVSGAGSLNGATYAGAIDNAGTLQISSSASQTFTGSISGTGSLIKDTSSTSSLTLSSSNSFSGDTTLSKGTIQYANAQALGTSNVTVSSGAVLDLNGFATQNNLTLSGSGISNGALINSSGSASSNSGNISLAANTTFYGAGNITLSGPISGAFGVTKAGANTLILTGLNTYTGDTTVSTGNFLISGSGSLNGGVYAGAVGVASTSSFQYASSASLKLSGVISGAGSITMGSGAGTLTLAGNNLYTGGTLVASGTLQVNSATALGASSSAVTVSSGGAIDLYGTVMTNTNSLTLNGVGSTGALTNSSANTSTYAGNVTLASASSIGSLSGNIKINGVVSGSNAAGLTVVGSSVLNLSGINTYTGGTTISSGTLQLGLANALPSSGSIVVASGAVLDLNGFTVTNTNALTLNGSGVSSSGALTNSSATNASYAGAISLLTDTSIGGSNANITLSGVLTTSNVLTKVGSNTVSLTNTNAVSGNIVIGAGTLQISGSGSINGTTYSGSISDSGTLQISSSANLTLSGVISGTGSLTKDTGASSSLLVSNTNTYSGNTTISSGTVKFANAQALGTSAVSVGSGAVLDLNGFATQNNLTLSGAGISSGALINSSISTAASNSGSITLAANTTIYGANNVTLSGIISGAFSLTNASAINLTLSGQNTYTGATTVAAGNVVLSSSGTLGGGTYSGAISLASGASLQYLSTSNQTFSGAITGLGNMVVNGAGSTLTLSNTSNTFSGTTTVNASTLSISSSNNISATSISIINAGTLVATSTLSLPKAIVVGVSGSSLGGGLAATTGNTLTENYVVSGVGPLLINPGSQTGTVSLGATNTHAGGTTVNGGWISFSSDAQFGSAGATLTLNGGGIQTGGVGVNLSTSGTNRPISIGASGGSIASIQNAQYTASLTIPGAIAGAGAYALNVGPLSGQNGTVNLTNSLTLGSISLGYGTLNFSGAMISTPLSTNTLTGALSVASGTTFNYSGANTNTTYQQFNSITGAGVIKFASGFVTISGDQTFTGTYYFNGATANITGGSSGLSAAGVGSAAGIYITNGTVTLSGTNDSFLGKTSTTPLYIYCFSSCSTTGGILTTSGAYSYHLGPVNFMGLGTITSPVTLTGDASTLGAYKFDGTISILNYDSGFASGTAANTYAYISANKIQLSQSGGAIINFNQQNWQYYYYTVGICQCTYYQSLNVSSAVLAPSGANNLTLQDAYNSQYSSGSSITMSGNLNINKLYVNAPSVTLTGSNSISSLYIQISEITVSALSIPNTTINFQGGTLGYGVGNNNDYSSQFAATNSSAINIDIASSTATYSTPITGTNILNLSGSTGILTLSSVNTLTGGVTVNSGTLKYGVQVALPITSTLNVNDWGILDIAGFTIQLGALKFTGSSGLTAYIKDTAGGGSISNTPINFNNQAGNINVSAVISGTSTVTEQDTVDFRYWGNGVSTLSGTNTYTGNTIINSGTLAIGNNSAIPSTSNVTLNTRNCCYYISTLLVGSYTDTVATLTAYEGVIGSSGSLNQGMLLTASSATNAFNFAPPSNYVVTVNTVLGGSGGLTHTATSSGPNTSGITVLNSSNVYSGGTYLLGGNLEITAAATSILRNSNITFNGGTLVGYTNNADLTLDTGYKLYFMATGGFAATSASHSFILPNQLLLGSNSTPTTTIWYGSLGNNGSVTLPNSDPNLNVYTGITEIGYGTLNLGASNAISTNSPIWLTNFGTFAMSTYNQNAISLQADSGSVTANTTNANQGVLTMPNTGTTTFLFDPANGVSITVQANLYSLGGGLTQTVPSGTAAGVSNTGITYLTGRSSYTGQTYVLGGNLSIISNSNIPSGSQINFNGGTLLGNATFTLSGYTLSFASGASGGFAATSGNTFTMGNALTTSGNVTVWYGSGSGSGTVNLPAGTINTYSGTTQVTYGTLAPLMNNAIPTTSSLTVNGGTYAMTTYNQTVTSVYATSGSITATTASPGTLTASLATALAFNFQPNYGVNFPVGAMLASSSATGGLTQSGPGTTTLQAANTYTGGTTINWGTLSISNDNNLGPSTGALTFNGTTTSYPATLYTTSLISLSSARSIVMSGVGNIETNSGNTFTIPSVISGNASTLYLNLNGNTGTILFSGANTYTGNLQIQNGTLKMGAANSLPSGSSLEVWSSSIFNIGSYNQSIGYISFYYNSPQVLGTGTLSFSNQFYFYNANATISTPLSGTGNLYINYGGNLTLSGANTYTGGTTILYSSTLTLGATNTIPSTGSLNIYQGSTLNMGAYNNTVGAINFQGATVNGTGNLNGSAFNFVNTSYGNYDYIYANLVGAGALTKSGYWNTYLYGTNTYSGGTYLQSGYFSVGASSLPSTGAVYISGGTLNLSGNTNVGAVTYSANNSYTTTNNANSTVPNSTTIVWAGNNNGTGYINNGLLIGTSWTFACSAQCYFPYQLTGTESVTQNGAGQTLLTNIYNNYTGGTFVTAGTLQINSSYNSTTGASVLPSGGALTINGGTLNLEGYNQTVGAVTFSGGSLEGKGIAPVVGQASPYYIAATPGNNILNGTSYSFTNAAGVSVIVNAILTGTGSTLTQSGAGTTTLNNVNTYTGLTTVSAGTLALGIAQAIPYAPGLSISGGTLALGTYALGTSAYPVSSVTMTGGNITSSTGILNAQSYVFNNTVSSPISVSAILAGYGTNQTSTTLTKNGLGNCHPLGS